MAGALALMVSHSLSRRRLHIARPIVCKKKPPVLPPVSWPPALVDMLIQATYNMMGVWVIDQSVPLPWVLPSGWAGGADFGVGGHVEVALPYDQPAQTVDIALTFTHPVGNAGATIANIAIDPDVPSIYVITVWDWKPAWLNPCKVVFTL